MRESWISLYGPYVVPCRGEKFKTCGPGRRHKERELKTESQRKRNEGKAEIQR